MSDLKSTVRIRLRVNMEEFNAAADQLEADIKKAIKKFNKNARFIFNDEAETSSFDRLGRVL